VFALALTLLAGTAGDASAENAADIDVTAAGATVVQDGAVYIQGPLPGSAGTGLIDPFLTDGGGGSQDITRSYNTDGTAEFDTVTGGDRTHSLNLAAVPETEYNGAIYKEFVLDINKAPGGSQYLAMNELQLWLTSDPNLSSYDLATYSFPSGATKIFDLDGGSDGDLAVLMDYSLESGSGASDLTWLVPLSVFGDLEDCDYGNTECTTYVVLFNEYGNYTETGADPDKWVNNDGFEEWGTVLRPVVKVTKDAAGTYDRTVTWTLNKSVDDDSHDGVAGQVAGTSNWTVEADKIVVEGNIRASGTITILNPTGGEGNPIQEDIDAVILSVEDVITQEGIGDTSATVDCGVTFPHTLRAGDTLTCDYEAFPANAVEGVNTATVTIEGLNETTSAFSGTADLAFTVNLIGYESGTLSDDSPYNPNGPTVINGDTTWNYSQAFTCSSNPADYTDGAYSFTVPNTATLNGNINLSDSASVSVNCYAPVVTKNANAALNREYQWTIAKGDDATYNDFIGDPANNHQYSITVTKTGFTDDAWSVNGQIFVTNNGPVAMALSSVVDNVSGVGAAVSCSGLTVSPFSTLTCTYEADSDDGLDGDETLNTATVTFNSINFSGTAAVSYVPNEINAQINVTDSATGEANQNFGPFSDSETFGYDRDFQCPADPSAYTDGFYTETRVNTATIDETSASDDATVTLNCYAPVVTKNASGSYDERHDWTVEKTVDVDTQNAFVADLADFEWTVTVTETVVEENWEVTGSITVANGHPTEAMTLTSLVDSVDGVAADVTCASLSVPAAT
jgi:hypothetical protein